MGNDKDYSKLLDSLKREKIDELSYKSFKSESDGGFDANLTFWADDYKARGDYDFISKKNIDEQTKEEKENFTKKRKEFVSDHFENLIKNIAPDEYAKIKSNYERSDSDESLNLSLTVLKSVYGLNMQEFNHYLNQSINSFHETGNSMNFINGVDGLLKHPKAGLMVNYSTKKLDHLLNENEPATEIIKAVNEQYIKPVCEKGLSDARIGYLAFDSAKAKEFLETTINTPSDEYFREHGLKRIVNDTYNNGTKRAA